MRSCCLDSVEGLVKSAHNVIWLLPEFEGTDPCQNHQVVVQGHSPPSSLSDAEVQSKDDGEQSNGELRPSLDDEVARHLRDGVE